VSPQRVDFSLADFLLQPAPQPREIPCRANALKQLLALPAFIPQLLPESRGLRLGSSHNLVVLGLLGVQAPAKRISLVLDASVQLLQ